MRQLERVSNDPLAVALYGFTLPYTVGRSHYAAAGETGLSVAHRAFC